MPFTDKQIADKYKDFLRWHEFYKSANRDLDNAIGRMLKFNRLAENALEEQRDMVAENRAYKNANT